MQSSIAIKIHEITLKLSDELPGISYDFLKEVVAAGGMGINLNNKATLRQQGNAIAYQCFRNRTISIESMHSGAVPINRETLMELMFESEELMRNFIKLKDISIKKKQPYYNSFCLSVNDFFCEKWIKDEIAANRNKRKKTGDFLLDNVITSLKKNSNSFFEDIINRLAKINIEEILSDFEPDLVVTEFMESHVFVLDCFILPLVDLLSDDGTLNKDLSAPTDIHMKMINMSSSERMTEWLIFRENMIKNKGDNQLYEKVISLNSHYLVDKFKQL